MVHQWNPEQYEKFGKERDVPFFDLIKMLHPVHAPRLLDVGCGNGRLTKIVHERLHAAYTLGIDASADMLEKAYSLRSAQLHFEEGEIGNFTTADRFSIILSNAALQWVPNHPELLAKLSGFLSPGGQLAIEMPANQHYPTHTIACELAGEYPFNQAVDTRCPIAHMMEMDTYAELIDRLGFESQLIRMQVYPHHLASTASLVEWVKGSLLTYYQSRLGTELYPQFLQEYKKRVLERLGWSEPFFFPMKRLFIWAQLPPH